MEGIYSALQAIGYTHPIHPAVTHLPVGIAIGTFLFALAAWIFKKPVLAQTARHCSLLALLAVPVAMAVGIMDWQHFYGGAWLFPIVMKFILAGLLFAALLTAVIKGFKKDTEIIKILPLYLFCFLLVIGLGFFGGELVYGNRGPSPIPAEDTGDTGPDMSQVRKGAELFSQKCSFCHNADSMETKIGPGLKGLFSMDAFPVSRWPATESSFRKQLKTPYQNMPPFPDLEAGEVAALVAYVKSL